MSAARDWLQGFLAAEARKLDPGTLVSVLRGDPSASEIAIEVALGKILAPLYYISSILVEDAMPPQGAVEWGSDTPEIQRRADLRASARAGLVHVLQRIVRQLQSGARKCHICGADLVPISRDALTVMCRRLHDEVLRRFAVGDRRAVSHDSLDGVGPN